MQKLTLQSKTDIGLISVATEKIGFILELKTVRQPAHVKYVVLTYDRSTLHEWAKKGYVFNNKDCGMQNDNKT